MSLIKLRAHLQKLVIQEQKILNDDNDKSNFEIKLEIEKSIEIVWSEEIQLKAKPNQLKCGSFIYCGNFSAYRVWNRFLSELTEIYHAWSHYFVYVI